MEDFKNCMLEFLKQQEKQRQEDLKQVKQRHEHLKRLHASIERQERFRKLLDCLTKENDPENLNIFSQKSVINSVGEFIYKPEEVTFEAISEGTNQFLKKIVKNDPTRNK